MNGRHRGPAPVTSLPSVPTMLRPLPHPVTPFANETLDSYRNRLAVAHQTEFRTVRNPSRWLPRPLDELERLGMLSGQPRTTLLRALPESRSYAPDIVAPSDAFILNTRAACDLRSERSGNNGRSIQVHLRGLHGDVCVRHRRWLSCGRANVFEQIDLSHAPEVVRAQRLLDRLGRRHGTFAPGTAHRHCERFWRGTDRRALVRGDRDSVLARIYRPDSKALPDRFDLIRSQRFHRAANYPQVARFTKLIISLAQRPETGRKVAHLTGTTQIEFEQAFRLGHRPEASPSHGSATASSAWWRPSQI
ncbi:hypothetical protein [Streptomyces viridosporus]|uniref:hypothetical protein n=1 Tax=Streptomyces viridosporus TaxID=67581 RepID=UPI00332DD310